MKIILYPTSRLGKLLLKWGWTKPTIIYVEFLGGKLKTTCNKKEQFENMTFEFMQSFTTHFNNNNNEQSKQSDATKGA